MLALCPWWRRYSHRRYELSKNRAVTWKYSNNIWIIIYFFVPLQPNQCLGHRYCWISALKMKHDHHIVSTSRHHIIYGGDPLFCAQPSWPPKLYSSTDETRSGGIPCGSPMAVRRPSANACCQMPWRTSSPCAFLEPLENRWGKIWLPRLLRMLGIGDNTVRHRRSRNKLPYFIGVKSYR